MQPTVPAISVIIPLYNCGKIFEKCLASVRDQSFRDFEVIIVDNGSQDESPAIAAEFVRSDPRFRVITRENGGVGEARSVGLSQARGAYVSFVDGDDRLGERCLEKLYEAACKHDADVAVCSYSYYYLKNGRVRNGIRMKDRVISRDRALCSLLQDRGLIRNGHFKFYLWGKLWRKSLFTEHDIVVPDMYYEDAAVTPQLFYCANKVATVSYCGYYYSRAFSKYRESRMTAQRVNDYINTVPMIRLLLEQYDCYEQFRKPLKLHVFHVYYSVPFLIRQCAAENTRSNRENIRSAHQKIRRCLKMSADELKEFDIQTPVVK